MVKVCERCGQQYVATTSIKVRRYCSQACYQAARLEKHSVTCRCEVCGTTFTIQEWRKKRTCSHKCAVAMRQRRVAKRCESCGREYEVPWNRRKESRFCSMACLGASLAVRSPTRRQLVHLLVFYSQGEIAKRYGVSAALVRKWCRQMGVTPPDQAERAWLKSLRWWERDTLAEGKELLTSSLPPGRLVRVCGPGAVIIPAARQSGTMTLPSTPGPSPARDASEACERP